MEGIGDDDGVDAMGEEEETLHISKRSNLKNEAPRKLLTAITVDLDDRLRSIMYQEDLN